MIRCLSVPSAFTRRKCDAGNFSGMQKFREIYFFVANLNRERVFRFDQIFVQFQFFFFVQRFKLCYDGVFPQRLLINGSFVLSRVSKMFFDVVLYLFRSGRSICFSRNAVFNGNDSKRNERRN